MTELYYYTQLKKLKFEGHITLNIGNHGLIFIQPKGGFMKSYNSYKEAFDSLKLKKD